MSNEIASTLFRFVNLRSPEPPKEAVKGIKYVLQPAAQQTGHFYTAVNGRATGVSKAKAMSVAAGTFSGPLTDAKAVRNISVAMHDFSDWLIRNKGTLTNADLEREALKVTATLPQDKQKQLWENLFYQVVTSKSFYVKEAIMQMLHANHVVTLLKRGDAAFNMMLAEARIALPGELFTDETVVAETPAEERGKNYVEGADPEKARFTAKARAEQHNAQLGLALKELRQLEKAYLSNYSKAYDTARREYDERHKPTLEAYYRSLEEARTAFCQVRNQDVKYDENDPCHQPAAVPYPSIPAFEFDFGAQVDWANLRAKMTPESYSVLTEAIGGEPGAAPQAQQRAGFSTDAVPADNDSYAGLYSQVNQLINLNNQQIQQNTVVTSPQVAVGGIVLPVAGTTTAPLFDDRYSVLNVKTGFTRTYSIWYWPPAAETVTKVVITQRNTNGTTTTFTKNAPVVANNAGRYELNSIFSHTFPNGSVANAPTFDFDIYLATGAIKRIKGILSTEDYGVRGYFEAGTLPPNTVTDPKAFVPPGFGFKQLGIADYLKVEQSVHCYIEGEVSHIENIMGREYKEKATRRLVRTEDTTTTSSESERENLTDTSTTDRFEMHTEIAKVIQETRDMSGFVNTGYSNSGFSIDAGLAFANNSSSENSTNVAVTKAQEITERAMDRVVARIKEERIRKVIEEFEENNKHGFDNREGDKHVVGVYRWVDKLYKNQIFNYGRRLMFEFMIPEPARLHLLGMQPDALPNGTALLQAPADPRTSGGSMAIPGYLSLDETKASYWAGVYNAEVSAKPENIITAGESFNINLNGGSTLADVECNSGNGKVTIPEGYRAISATGIFNAVSDNKGGRGRLLSLTIGNRTKTNGETFGAKTIMLDTAAYVGAGEAMVNQQFSQLQIGNEVPVSFTLGNHISGDISVTVKCQLTEAALNEWKQKAFKAIIDAYEQKLEEYNAKLEEQKNVAVEIKRTNPGFYRQMENMILRKNCISYLIDRTPSAQNTYGKTMAAGTEFTNYEVTLNQQLADYGAFVKFMEQAFEWNIMSYNFYPYYWAPRSSWKEKYQFDEATDPLFRNFIQAGMAQVIVTVRPGFEEAVYHYLKTGKIWNGGQVPVIGDDMYMDIVSQVRTIPAEPVGKAWITRLPTDLTILQADSIGLVVEKALPCNCDDTADFENPEAIPCSDSFEINTNLIGVPAE